MVSPISTLSNANGQFYNVVNSGVPNQTQGQASTSLVAPSFNFTSAEENALKNLYKKENTYVQEWGSIPATIASMAFMEETQNMLHPFKALKAIKNTDKVFDLSKASIKKVWDTKPDLAQELYSELNVINRNARKGNGFFSGWFVKKADPKTVEWAEKLTKEALEDGSDEALLRATEQLKASRGCDGKFFELFKSKAKKGIDPITRSNAKAESIEKAVSEQLKERTSLKNSITSSSNAATTQTLQSALGPTIKSTFKRGLKESKAMIAISLLLNVGKIKTAYDEGGLGSAVKQTAQTSIKAVLDGLGWAVGRAVGGVVGAKAGAAIGTAICPGLGTLAGGIIGFAGAAVGSILANKIGNLIIPVEEATKLEAEKSVKTDAGKQKLLTLVMQKAKDGKEVDPLAIQAAQKLAMQYGVQT